MEKTSGAGMEIPFTERHGSKASVKFHEYGGEKYVIKTDIESGSGREESMNIALIGGSLKQFGYPICIPQNVDPESIGLPEGTYVQTFAEGDNLGNLKPDGKWGNDVVNIDQRLAIYYQTLAVVHAVNTINIAPIDLQSKDFYIDFKQEPKLTVIDWNVVGYLDKSGSPETVHDDKVDHGNPLRCYIDALRRISSYMCNSNLRENPRSLNDLLVETNHPRESRMAVVLASRAHTADLGYRYKDAKEFAYLVGRFRKYKEETPEEVIEMAVQRREIAERCISENNPTAADQHYFRYLCAVSYLMDKSQTNWSDYQIPEELKKDVTVPDFWYNHLRSKIKSGEVDSIDQTLTEVQKRFDGLCLARTRKVVDVVLGDISKKDEASDLLDSINEVYFFSGASQREKANQVVELLGVSDLKGKFSDELIEMKLMALKKDEYLPDKVDPLLNKHSNPEQVRKLLGLEKVMEQNLGNKDKEQVLAYLRNEGVSEKYIDAEDGWAQIADEFLGEKIDRFRKECVSKIGMTEQEADEFINHKLKGYQDRIPDSIGLDGALSMLTANMYLDFKERVGNCEFKSLDMKKVFESVATFVKNNERQEGVLSRELLINLDDLVRSLAADKVIESVTLLNKLQRRFPVAERELDGSLRDLFNLAYDDLRQLAG